MNAKTDKQENILCVVYRSERKEGCYLYLPHPSGEEALNKLPDALRQQLGKLTQVMPLKLNRDKKLANADVNNVLQALRDPGYYLQLPPLEQREKP